MSAKQNVYISLIGKDEVSKTLKNVQGGLKSLGSGAQAVGSAMLKVGAVAFAAAGTIAAGIAAATKAAAEEEKGILRLNTAIEANSKKKVDLGKVDEAVAKQQNKLAYSDGEIRDSLAALLPFTKDVNKAMEVQGVAADLARAKNMDLTTASMTVAKAMNGSQRALKELGIELPKTASQAEILAAIQSKVAGQADAYANSTEGQFTKLKNSFDDIIETLGAQFLPIATDLAKWANESLLPAIQAVLPSIVEFGKGFIAAAVGIGEQLWPVLQAVAKFVFENVIPVLKDMANALFGKGGIAESVMGVVGPIIKDLLPVFGKIFSAVVGLIGKVGEFIGVLWGNGSGPLAVAVKGIGLAFQVVGTIFGGVVDAIAAVLDIFTKLVRAIMDSPVGWVIEQIGSFIGDLIKGLARGGPTSAGTPYMVGERGPELFVPNTTGRIVPTHRLDGFSRPTMSAPGGLSSEGIRDALSGLVVVMDGERVGTLVDHRIAATIRGTRTSSRLGA